VTLHTGGILLPAYTDGPHETVEELSFYVEGVPAPQGSKTPNRGGFGFHEASKGLPAWRKRLVAKAVEVLAGREGFPRDEPIYCALQFYMPRGRTVKRKHPTVTPDVDKLERAVLDAMTIAKVWGDDAQVVSGTRGKRYADECAPGVRIVIRSAA
jgi:Holliday junction resolvase RusA-like endonuclease